MKIISYNLNGIRSAISKNLLPFLVEHQADIVCFQELKANETQIDQAAITQAGYPHQYYFAATKKGYSGVGIISKQPPKKITLGCNHPLFDYEGRVIQCDFEHFSVISVYFPSGASGDERQGIKMEFLQFFYDYIKKLQQINLPLIICGDYNIAHQPIDIHDPKSNAKSTGFLPEERQWLTDFLALELADAYRHLHPTAAHNYSWWSTRFKTVRLQNKGWRIDYQVISQSLLPHLHQAYMLPHAQQSDHCAVVVQLQNL